MDRDDTLAPGGGGGSSDDETPTFFALGLYVPTVVDESGDPLLARNFTSSGRGRGLDRLVTVPSEVISSTDDRYTVKIPFVLWWNSNVEDDEIGRVTVTTNHGTSETLDSSSGKRTGAFRVQYDSTIDDDGVVALNYFQNHELKLFVNFSGDSELADLAPFTSISASSDYATPNKSVTGVRNVLDVAETVTDEGLSAAGRLTGVKHTGFLRKAARMLAYGYVRGIDTVSEQDIGGDLVRHAAVKGIGGFKETVEEASKLEGALGANQSLYTSMLGPTIKFDDFGPDIAVRPSSPTVREEVTLGPSWSSMPDVPIERYEWEIEMDDGTLDSGRGETFTVSFPRQGTYDISLETTDEDGNTGTTRRSISVEP